MADEYESLAKRMGIPLARIPDWKAMAGAPAPPSAAPPSYEGATLQGFMPPAPVPAGPPAPRPSYEGASLTAPVPAGISLAGPPPGAPTRPPMRLATGDNVQSAPAAVSPKVMSQMGKVADASDATQKNVRTALDDNERKKNLEGATFHDPAEGAPTSPGGAGGMQLVDKGGRRPASWSVTQGLDLGGDVARGAEGETNERGVAAAGLDLMAGRQAAEFERGYLEQHLKAAERFATEDNDRVNRYADQVNAHTAKLEGMLGQIREAKIDPYAGMNPAVARIGGAIAMALGAFASRRGENMGLEAVKHTIDSNIRDQEIQLHRLERGARGEANYLAQLKASFGDIRAAKSAAYVSYLERAKIELAKKLGDPEVADPRMLAGYERLMGRLNDEQMTRMGQFKQATQDRIVRHDVNAQPRYVGTGGFTHKDETDAKWLAEQREKAGIPQALANLEGVDQAIDTFGEGDIEGVGRFASKVPDAIYGVVGSKRGQANRQAMAAIKNRVRKSIAGASLTDGEKVELNKELEGAGDADSLRRSVQSVRRSLQHQDTNLRAGTRPGGEAFYEARGGQKRIPLDKPTTPHLREPK